jgi:hypothetical protein
MSWFGGIVDTISSIFSFSSSSNNSRSENHNSSSTTQTVYEPDKVRVAELENQRSEMLVEAQKDIIELNARMQAAVIEANVRGFEYSANVLKSMMTDMNIIAQQRLQLLENGHFEIVKQIECLYLDLEREIKKDNLEFQIEKLPQMFDVLSKFPEDSAAHKMYLGSIDQQIQLNISFVADKFKGLTQRQHTLITASTDTKKLVLEQSGQLVADRMKFLEQQIEHKGTSHLNAPEKHKSLPSANRSDGI